MKSTMKRFNLLALLITAGLSLNTMADPGWHTTSPNAPIVSPEAAYQSQAAFSTQSIGASVSQKSIATFAQVPEIKELARGLHHDPVLIYDYIKNTIDYVPYYGYLKGPYLTLMDKSGNDFDQASLLIALLKASGYDATFVFGNMTMPVEEVANNKDLAHWFGVEADIDLIKSVIGQGNIPASFTDQTARLSRVWVEASINGNTVLLDPAFKIYQRRTDGVDLDALIPESASDFESVAGGSGDSSSISGLNENAIADRLSQATMDFVAKIRAEYSDLSTADLLGAYEIVPERIAELPNSLDFPYEAVSQFTDVPAQFIHTVRIQHGGLDETLNIPDIAGRKLSMHYESITGNSLTTLNTVDETVSEPVSMGPTDQGIAGPILTPTSTATQCDTTKQIFIGQTVTLNCRITNEIVFDGTYGGQVLRIGDDFLAANLNINRINRASDNGAGFRTLSGFNVPFTQAFATTRNFRLSFTATREGTFTYGFNLQGTAGSSNPEYSATINPFVSNTFFVAVVVAGDYQKAILSLDDEVIATEVPPTNTNQDTVGEFTLSVNHPYAAAQGRAVDQTVQYQLRRGGNYVILSDFGGSRYGELLSKRQQLLSAYQESEAEDSRKLLTEAMNVMGITWMYETSLSLGLLDQLIEQSTFMHHRFGVFAQEEGFYIDIKAQSATAYQRTVNGDATNSVGGARAAAFLQSALEHGVIEQMQDTQAASTVKMLVENNRNNKRIFRATQSNWSSVRS